MAQNDADVWSLSAYIMLYAQYWTNKLPDPFSVCSRFLIIELKILVGDTFPFR